MLNKLPYPFHKIFRFYLQQEKACKYQQYARNQWQKNPQCSNHHQGNPCAGFPYFYVRNPHVVILMPGWALFRNNELPIPLPMEKDCWPKTLLIMSSRDSSSSYSTISAVIPSVLSI